MGDYKKINLSDFPPGILVCAGSRATGDNPHLCPFGDTSFLAAGFIPTY